MTETPVTPSKSDSDIELAAITGAHGVAGEVRLKLLGEGLDALKQHEKFNADVPGGTLTLSKIRSDNKGGAIARFKGVDGRGAAEKLRGTVLKIAREALPILESGEYYHADLIGLSAITDAGDRVGQTIAVHNFGATDIVEIEKQPVPQKGTKTFMVPMTEAAVLEWDSESIVIAADYAD